MIDTHSRQIITNSMPQVQRRERRLADAPLSRKERVFEAFLVCQPLKSIYNNTISIFAPQRRYSLVTIPTTA
jgi:hypothetical protein